MSAHTPGPWEACEQDRVLTGPFAEEHACWFITGDDGTDEGVCIASLDSGYTGAQTEANAHLIAAAPDLLVALEELVTRRERVVRKQGGSLDGSDGRYVRARAALAKAKGERP